MRKAVRVITAGTLVGASLVVGLSAPAAARGKCADYPTQEAAQADLPNFPRLDGNHDGVACEDLPHASRSVTVIQAPCATDPTASVTRLYLAYFLRQPDAGGLAFWVDRCNRNISSLVDISDAFVGSPEFSLRYGALDDVAFVTLVYHNVLDRQPDAGGLKASVDFLGRGARRGEVMLGFSESPEFIAKSGVGSLIGGPVGAGLESLRVAPATSGTGYSRAQFGDGWIDADHDGCDTREEVLIAESIEPPVVSRIGGCAVASGRWLDPYTATTYTSPGELDIDHVVPLADAWVSGASTWSSQERISFANDLDAPELVAVSFLVNRSKGDRSPDEWKPPNRGDWCAYAEAWVAVKAKWHLTITAPEKAALASMLFGCPA